MCQTHKDSRFADLGEPNRIWAISAIHADIDRLVQIHDAIFERFRAGDRLLYLGNYTGFGAYARETVDELLTFRRLILAQPSVIPSDIVYLRGVQEDLWHKIIQLQFDPDPVNALIDMIGKGLNASLQSYGLCAHDGVMAAREGMMALTRWTRHIQETIRRHEGHGCLMTQPKRAAFLQQGERFPFLFVNAGLNPQEPLHAQQDHLWHNDQGFETMRDPYNPFEKVVRGYDPAHRGVSLNCIKATLDGGCGFGGNLVCAALHPSGIFEELIEA